jgi:hypothetical protein
VFRSLAMFPCTLAVVLLVAGPLRAAVFTVGPGGTHSTIQAAVSAALGQEGSHEIRVATGTYFERVNIGNTITGKSVALTGGWSASFSERDPNPLVTVVDAQGIGRALRAQPEGGTLVVDGFTFLNGFSNGFGGGVMVQRFTSGSATISNNIIAASSAVNGGGIYVDGTGTASISVLDNLIQGNTAGPVGSGAIRGAGLSVRALGGATFIVRRNLIEGNQIGSVETAGSSVGGGVYIKLQENPFVDFSDNVLRSNLGTGPGIIQGVGGALHNLTGFPSTGMTLEARRNQWLDNVQEASGVPIQVDVTQHVSVGTLLLTDSVIAGGDGVGIAYIHSGTMALTNLTVVGHAGAALMSHQNANLTSAPVHNTIFYQNETEPPLSGVNHNLVGVDPLFVDAGSHNYRLLANSPVVDAGDNAAPALGSQDVYGGARIASGTVDIGAAERPKSSRRCGLGFEVVFALAPLWIARRRFR